MVGASASCSRRSRQHALPRCVLPRKRDTAKHRAVSKGADMRELSRYAPTTRSNLPHALAGAALAARQFALLNRMRNTDNFFMGVKKN